MFYYAKSKEIVNHLLQALVQEWVADLYRSVGPGEALVVGVNVEVNNGSWWLSFVSRVADPNIDLVDVNVRVGNGIFGLSFGSRR